MGGELECINNMPRAASIAKLRICRKSRRFSESEAFEPSALFWEPGFCSSDMDFFTLRSNTKGTSLHVGQRRMTEIDTQAGDKTGGILPVATEALVKTCSAALSGHQTNFLARAILSQYTKVSCHSYCLHHLVQTQALGWGYRQCFGIQFPVSAKYWDVSRSTYFT